MPTLAEQLEKLDSYIDFVFNTKCEAMKSNSCSCVTAGRLMTRHSIEDANVYKTKSKRCLSSSVSRKTLNSSLAVQSAEACSGSMYLLFRVPEENLPFGYDIG